MKIQVFLKTSVLKNFENISGKHLRWETPSGPQPATLLKEIPAQLFSCKTFKSTFFYRANPVAAF